MASSAEPKRSTSWMDNSSFANQKGNPNKYTSTRTKRKYVRCLDIKEAVTNNAVVNSDINRQKSTADNDKQSMDFIDEMNANFEDDLVIFTQSDTRHCIDNCNKHQPEVGDSVPSCDSDDMFGDLFSPHQKKRRPSLSEMSNCSQLRESFGDADDDEMLAALDIEMSRSQDQPEITNEERKENLLPGNITKVPTGCSENSCHDLVDLVDQLQNGSDEQLLHLSNTVHPEQTSYDHVICRKNCHDVSCGPMTTSCSAVISPGDITDDCSKSSVDGNTSDSDVLKAPHESVPCVPKMPAAIYSARRRTLGLAVRIKQAMYDNAKIDTPPARKPKTLESALMLQPADAVSHTGTGSVLVVGYTDNDVGSFYGLPVKVKQLLITHRSISDLYPWQKECLSLPALRSGSNLIYSLPTSGGKTLVAEMLIFQQLLCNQKDALLILPFVALVQEKVRGLSPFAVELDFLVEEYAASKGQIPPRQRRKRQSLYIATIEKANSLVNSLIEQNRIASLGLVVVDELHMLGEGGSRGAVLEMCLTKLMHASSGTQIVGMSATLSNISDLQEFLRAEVYTNDFRPVELREYVKMDDAVYEIDTTALCDEDRVKFSRPVAFKYTSEQSALDVDRVVGLVLEIVPQNSCLVFCPTKKNCENVALLVCKFMNSEHRDVKRAERDALRRALRADSAGEICPVLRQTITFGVAYHHSGLTMDERKLIEEAYLDGTLCVLCCTSTLAAGVNLPAKRVVLRSPYVGRCFLSRSQYKQMVGRAGRAGLDSIGESILILDRRDRSKLLELVGGAFDKCRSSLLYDDGKGIRTLLLTTIGLKITPTETDVERFMKRTLCSVQNQELSVDMRQLASSSVQRLVDLSLVIRKCDDTVTTDGDGDANTTANIRLDVTNLGRAVYKGSIDIDRGAQVYADLVQAQQSLVVSSYLHLLYLATPYDMVSAVQPDWMIYLQEISNLSAAEMKVAGLVGVSEGYVAKMASGRVVRTVVDKFVVSRFYVTLMLLNLWKQRTVWQVSSRFHQSRGFVQQLLTSAASFAACLSHFCQELDEFWAYQDLLTNFVKKLSYCCTMELIALMEIPGIKLGRARQLYAAGFRTLQHVAFADPEQLVRTIEHLPRRVARQIVSTAQMLLAEKAEALLEEAEILSAVPTDLVGAAEPTTDPKLALQQS